MTSEDLFFDTGALIDIFIGRERIKPYFDRLRQQQFTGYMSVISEAELWRGLRPGELQRHEALVAQFIVVPLRSDAACLAGLWMQKYAAVGLGWTDALIAASASVTNVTLLTRDKKLATVLSQELSFEILETS